MTEILGAAGAILVTLTLSLFLIPMLEPLASELLVRVFGGWAPRQREPLVGSWAFVWARDGEQLSRGDEQQVDVRQFLGRLFCEFQWKGRKYRLRGLQEGPFVTGRYNDRYRDSTYHGAFQLRVDPRGEHLIGRWVGFNRDNTVIGGPWQWRRLDHHYPYERSESPSHSPESR